MTDPWSILTPAQETVARTFLAAREAERKHLVIYLSGAHAYGFPSPDSDLDLKCIHIAPTADLVGLDLVDDPKDRIEIVDGVELGYGSNELAPVLRGSIKGNGNYLEWILGDLAVGGDRKLLAEARLVVKPLLSPWAVLLELTRGTLGHGGREARRQPEQPAEVARAHPLDGAATTRSRVRPCSVSD